MDLREGFSAIPRHLFGYLTAYELAVLAAIHSRYPNAYPTINLLAHDAGMSRRSAERTLISLRDKGLVVWESGKDAGTSNLYRLTSVFFQGLSWGEGVGHTDVPGTSHRHTGYVRETHKVEQEKKNKGSTPRKRAADAAGEDNVDPRVTDPDADVFDDAPKKKTRKKSQVPAPGTPQFCWRRFDGICKNWRLDYNVGAMKNQVKILHERDELSYEEIAAFMEYWAAREDHNIIRQRAGRDPLDPSQAFRQSVSANMVGVWQREFAGKHKTNPYGSANERLGL